MRCAGPSTADPSCPRCGYDQSGIASAWTTSCPLTGRCTECGLDFRWAEVLNSTLSVPRWSFEHAATAIIRAWLFTFARALAPWRLYRDLRMVHPVILGRVLLYGTACLLLNHALLSFLWLWALKMASLRPWATILNDPDSRTWIAKALLAPYFIPTDNPGFHRWSGIHWVWLGTLWMLLTPPAFFLLRRTMIRGRVRASHIARAASYSLAALPLLVAIPAGARILAFAHATTVALFSLPPSTRLFLRAAWVVVPLTAVWLVLYWWIAARQYLRLPHSGSVALLLNLMTFLASFTLVLAADPRLQRDLTNFISWLLDAPRAW